MVIGKYLISHFELLPVITVHCTVMLQNWDALIDFVNIILKTVDDFSWTQSDKKFLRKDVES